MQRKKEMVLWVTQTDVCDDMRYSFYKPQFKTGVFSEWVWKTGIIRFYMPRLDFNRLFCAEIPIRKKNNKSRLFRVTVPVIECKVEVVA